MRMCSKRKAPTGMIPVRECNRRKMKEVPCPARRGATPCTAPRVPAGAVELTAEATNAPYKFLLVQKWKKNFVLSAQPTRQVKKGHLVLVIVTPFQEITERSAAVTVAGFFFGRQLCKCF